MAVIDVITGFLGAGKTTFIQKYTQWLNENGVSFCVIENEFGRAGVDGAVLSGSGVKVKEISGGCICCTLKVTMFEMLADLSQKVDRIIVEPSGLFCGDDFMDIAKSPQLKDNITVGMWVGIVDPFSIRTMSPADIDVLKSELNFAGSIVLSKTQLSNSSDIRNTKEFISNLLSENIPVIYDADWNSVDNNKWFQPLQENGTVERTHVRKRFNHATMFQSTSFSPLSHYEADQLQTILTKVMQSNVGEVLRIKGTLCSNDNSIFQVNCTPECITLEKHNENGSPMLNIIGRNLDRKGIKKLFGM